MGKLKWGPFFTKRCFFSCKNGKFTRGGRFFLAFTGKNIDISTKDKNLTVSGSARLNAVTKINL